MSDLVDTLAALVRINSVDPAYEGGPGEAAIAAWVHTFEGVLHVRPLLHGLRFAAAGRWLHRVALGAIPVFRQSPLP